MYENDPGRTVALVIIGVYIGAAAMIALKAYRDEQRHLHGLVADQAQRLFLLENPDLAETDAEES